MESEKTAALWHCKDIFGLPHIAYLKAKGDDNYILMSRKEGKRDVKLQPRGKGMAFHISAEELSDAIEQIEAFLRQHSVEVKRQEASQ